MLHFAIFRKFLNFCTVYKMDLKETIEDVLKSLKEKDYSRGKIEKELGLGENSIDQNLSRGGTKKMLSRLKLLDNQVLQNATPSRDDLLTTLVQELVTLSRTTNRILNQQTQDLADKIKKIDSNLSLVSAQGEILKVDIESSRTVMLKSLARIEGKKPGQLLDEADSIKISLLRAKNEIYKTRADRK